jgi:hypothetical protein
LGIALVLLLGTANVAPTLHEWLHVDADHDAEHQCAVVLFASGVTLAAATIAFAAPDLVWNGRSDLAPRSLFLMAPRYLRQPERGPPVG